MYLKKSVTNTGVFRFNFDSFLGLLLSLLLIKKIKAVKLCLALRND